MCLENGQFLLRSSDYNSGNKLVCPTCCGNKPAIRTRVLILTSAVYKLIREVFITVFLEVFSSVVV